MRLILQKKLERNVQGIPVYSCVQQLHGSLSHGYQVGESPAFIRHWSSVVKSAQRQADANREPRFSNSN